VQGTTLAENNWLRSWNNDTYLWYDEVIDRDPGFGSTADYFSLLKTNATTTSGTAKDKFHFTYKTDDWIALSQSGVSAGYGVQWAVVASKPPRRVVVAYTEGGPAAAANLQRGETVLTVDGVDVVSSNTVSEINVFARGLYPEQLGEIHTFTLQNPQTLASRVVTLTATTVTSEPVQNVKVLQTAAARVGYLQFNDHLATAEAALVSAVDTLRQSSPPITELVLDIRYNGGGLLAVASELAYMIAGPVPTAGQTFERLTFNDKHPSTDPVTGDTLQPLPFITTTLGFSTSAGQPLPTLSLPRVFVLTGPSTCSASESIMNSLRGVGVQVIQIGTTTCGKPYGFHPADNCGTTYFTIQFKGVNAAGFGEYTDGFTPSNSPTPGQRVPGCSVADDFTHALGDPADPRIAAAVQYMATSTCPTPTAIDPTSPLSAADGVVIKPLWLQNRSLDAR
jgi:C-terminal processing protease CtpA/Prc